MRRTFACVAVLVALPLAACTTTVAGSGRAAGVGSGPVASGSSSAGPFDATGDAHDVWHRAVKASTPTTGSVSVGGLISYAGVDGARIKGDYGTDDSGNPIADIDVVTPDGGTLEVIATGGKAWARADASVYQDYGYSMGGAQQASGKAVVLADPDSVLLGFADLPSLLSLYGPTDDDPASVESGTFGSKHPAVVVHDDKYGTEVYLEPSDGHAFAASFQDETVLFSDEPDRVTVTPPAASDVVTVDGF